MVGRAGGLPPARRERAAAPRPTERACGRVSQLVLEPAGPLRPAVVSLPHWPSPFGNPGVGTRHRSTSRAAPLPEPPGQRPDRRPLLSRHSWTSKSGRGSRAVMSDETQSCSSRTPGTSTPLRCQVASGPSSAPRTRYPPRRFANPHDSSRTNLASLAFSAWRLASQTPRSDGRRAKKLRTSLSRNASQSLPNGEEALQARLNLKHPRGPFIAPPPIVRDANPLGLPPYARYRIRVKACAPQLSRFALSNTRARTAASHGKRQRRKGATAPCLASRLSGVASRPAHGIDDGTGRRPWTLLGDDRPPLPQIEAASAASTDLEVMCIRVIP
jgi:hypothetical protein